jgi:hypothetical protein
VWGIGTCDSYLCPTFALACQLTGHSTACIIVLRDVFLHPAHRVSHNWGAKEAAMPRKRSKAEVEELDDEVDEELDLEDLDDEADVEDEDVEEEDDDGEDEEEAPRKKSKSKKSKATAKKKAAKGTIGSQELAEALGTDGRNLRVMLRAKGVEKNENNRYEWDSVDDALEELGFEDLEDAQDALKEARDERLEELKSRAKKKPKKSKSKKAADEDEDEDDEDDDEDDDEEEEAPAPKKKAAAKKPTRRAKK